MSSLYFIPGYNCPRPFGMLNTIYTLPPALIPQIWDYEAERYCSCGRKLIFNLEKPTFIYCSLQAGATGLNVKRERHYRTLSTQSPGLMAVSKQKGLMPVSKQKCSRTRRQFIHHKWIDTSLERLAVVHAWVEKRGCGIGRVTGKNGDYNRVIFVFNDYNRVIFSQIHSLCYL
jgi:hypothetical protein